MASDDRNDADNDDLNFNNVPKNITELAERKVRLAKAQADIDRLLNSPVDPPFDVETELKKVASISPALIPEDSPEYALEEQVSQMENELYKSVKQTNFAKAAKQSQEISLFHLDDCGLVLQVNSRFYNAFNRKDVNDMRDVWLQDKSCVCIHPSQKPLMGIQAIQNSWEHMFEAATGSYQRNWIEPKEIRLQVKATMAIITCEEHVYARRFIRGQKRQTELINKLQVTNIFRKIGGRWFMTYHHASWHADSEAAKQALKRPPGGKRTRGKAAAAAESPNADIDNILGISNYGPLLGDESKAESQNKPVKRVIMGSLSDILNGNLGGLLGEDDDDDDNDDDDDDEDTVKSGAIISFSRVSKVDDDDDMDGYDIEVNVDDDDDDDDDDEDDDLDTLNQVRGWAKKGSNNNKSRKKTRKTTMSKNSPPPHDRRQRCIAALRKLANEGRISAKQKRSLLTDIISCSAKGELSMVEVAYDLLCCSTSDASNVNQPNEDAEEEFADQCIIFAQTFTDNNQ